MPSSMTVYSLSVAGLSDDRLNDYGGRRNAQCRGEHQNQRGNNSECQKGKQNLESEADYIRRIATNPPHQESRNEPNRDCNRAAAISDYQPRLAMRALQAVRERHNARRRNAVSAVRTHSDSQCFTSFKSKQRYRKAARRKSAESPD